MCFMFALLDCFLKRYIQHNKECKYHIKGKNEIFFAKSLKLSEVQTGHSHAYPLHFKLMPTTSLSHILHNVETRDHLTTFSTQNWKKVLLDFSDYLSDFFPSRLWLVMSAYVLLLTTPFLFIIAENSNQHFKLSIIGDYTFFLISSKYSYNFKQKGKKLTVLFSCPIITTNLFITTDFL